MKGRREKEMRRKAEERARKALEKARKALEKARKAEERKQKKNTRSTSGRKQWVRHPPDLPAYHMKHHHPRRLGLQYPLAAAAVMTMYAACTLVLMTTTSWREQAQNGFPVHVVDGCMEIAVKTV